MAQYSSTDSRIPGILKLLAHTRYQIEIPDKVLEGVALVTATAGILDDELDHEGNTEKRAELSRSVVEFFAGTLEELTTVTPSLAARLTQWRQLGRMQDPSQLDSLVQHLEEFFKVTEDLKNQKGLLKCIGLKFFEGELVGRIYTDLLPQSIRAQQGFNKLLRTFELMSVAAVHLDHAFDLPDDYAHGETRLKPTWFARCAFFMVAAFGVIRILTRLNIPLIFEALGFMRREYYRRKSENNPVAK